MAEYREEAQRRLDEGEEIYGGYWTAIHEPEWETTKDGNLRLSSWEIKPIKVNT